MHQSLTQPKRKFMIGQWTVMAWFGVSIGLLFIIGGFVLLSQYIPPLTEWTRCVTLYDFFSTVGFGYALLMSLAALTFGFEQREQRPYTWHELSLGFFGVIGFSLLLYSKFGRLLG